MNKETCKERVGSGTDWRFRRCSKPVWKDGWCVVHHPEKEAERRKKQRVQRDVEERERRRQRAVAEAKEEVVRAAVKWATIEGLLTTETALREKVEALLELERWVVGN